LSQICVGDREHHQMMMDNITLNGLANKRGCKKELMWIS